MVDLSSDLPAGLEAALSYSPPGPAWWRPLLLAAIVAAGLAFRAWRQRRWRQPAAPTSEVAPGPVVSPEDPVAAIEAHHLRTESFREGCHALADLLRQRADWALSAEGGDASTLTALELMAAARDPAAGALMRTLRDHRFGRSEPDERVFRTACTDTRAVLRVAR